jgi:hypothetical protein
MDVGGGKCSGGPGWAGDLLGGLGFSILFLFVLVGWSRYFCFALFASIAFSPLFLTLLRFGLVSWLTCVLSFPFSYVSLRLSVLFLLTVFGYAMLPSGVVRGRKTAGLVALWLRLRPMGHLYSFSCGFVGLVYWKTGQC